MEFKSLEEEIEYVYSNKTNKEFVRNENFMFKIIVNATNTYNNLSLFYNDYRHLYEVGIIDESWYISSVNDLYLLALIHTNKNDWDRIIQDKQKDERARLKRKVRNNG